MANTLKDEPLAVIQEHFDHKNSILAGYGEQVSPATFYEDIFGDLDMEFPVVTLHEDDDKKGITIMTVDEALTSSGRGEDTLMGGVAYFNNWVSKKSAKDIYTFIIDMDNVYSAQLELALKRDWRSANNEPFAMPTYIVNSGTGLHLYFVLKEPLPCFRRQLSDIDRLYRSLATQQSRRNYLIKQIHWFGQEFRMAGGFGKYGWENTVFKIGDRWEVDKLAGAVGVEKHFYLRGEELEELPTATLPKKSPGRKKGFFTNSAFYEHALAGCRDKTKEGNRYTSMCALSIIAWKCGVDKDRLKSDLYSLLPEYNRNATSKIKEREIFSAMKMYNEKAMQTPRNVLQDWQGWEYKPKIQRKGLKRNVHLELARRKKADLKELEILKPEGRPSAKNIVINYRNENPDSTKSECHRQTKLSRPTISKWWGAAADESVAAAGM